eukprot:gb/GEZN01019432.1/.p1 GENE.gb/GEZN01019432.1/~~gb/GEZN01019432.1/.p1  ORF type:complete len:182 (-),score=26.23 gb/GEZN01019432.1/:132-677(-)
MNVTIAPEYGYVMMAVAGIWIEGVLIGGKVMSIRTKLFGPEGKLAKNSRYLALMDAHKKATGTSLTLGYPDMGCGRHSDLLEYEDWLMFNNAQRGHYNLVESVAPNIAVLLLSGLQFPKVAASLGGFFILGRWLYATGYIGSGAKGRTTGAIMAMLAGFANAALTLYSGAKMAGVLSVMGI